MIALSQLLTEIGSRFAELRSGFIDHLLVLTLVPVAAAIVLAIPLAVLVRERPPLRTALIGLSTIVQTVPSLAMLAFLLPLLGIGKPPAVVALTLYAILPILQNTITGLRDLPKDVLEAAAGMGFSPFQRLRWVELPLALPIIMSGVRTATVICVGIATLATFIGAGGLGDFINRGLILSRTDLLLIGAGFAALLALALDFALETAGLAFSPGRKNRGALRWRFGVLTIFAALFGALLAGPGRSQGDPRERTIRIATKNFTEQLILGEILKQWIEERTDLKVELKQGLGGTLICHQALLKGEIDLYVEYTGTALQTILKEQRSEGASATNVFALVEEAYAEQFSCRVFPSFGFENTYAIAVQREKARGAGWQSISDLGPAAPAMLAGFTAEFIERSDGLPGLRTSYGLRFKRVVDLLPDLMYSALAEGEVDVICAFSTDGRILKHDLQVLTDNRGFFPPYEACPVARSEILTRHPELAAALLELRDTIDAATMTRLNNEAYSQQKTPAEIAEAFLNQDLR